MASGAYTTKAVAQPRFQSNYRGKNLSRHPVKSKVLGLVQPAAAEPQSEASRVSIIETRPTLLKNISQVIKAPSPSQQEQAYLEKGSSKYTLGLNRGNTRNLANGHESKRLSS
jgi:hypothetical protein